MKIECISIGELEAWVTSSAFQELDTLPISHRRGIAHARNPRAQANDIALVLAYLEDRLVGYLGLLPDECEGERIAWMSCIWVDPQTRGKGVAKSLLSTAYEAWNHRLLATEFTAPAKKLYDRLGWFEDWTSKQGVRAYLHFNLAYLLPKKNPKWRYVKPVLRLGDATLNLFNRFRLMTHKNPLPSNIRLDYQQGLDEEAKQFIAKNKAGETMCRGEKELHWLQEYPWLGSEAADEKDAQKYYFSVFAEHFRFVVLKIKKEEQVLALLILAERDDHLKIPYCWLEKDAGPIAANAIIQHLRQHRMSMVTCYHPQLVSAWQIARTPFFKLRTFQREYLITSEAATKKAVVLQDGDGDCAFT